MLNVNNNAMPQGFQPIVNPEDHILNQTREKIKEHATTAVVISIATILGGVGVGLATQNGDLALKSAVFTGVVAGAGMQTPLSEIFHIIMYSSVGFFGGTISASYGGETNFHASLTGLMAGVTCATIAYVLKKTLLNQ